MTSALLLVLFGTLLLLLLQALILHLGNRIGRLRTSTYLHCVFIVMASTLVGVVFQLGGYLMPTASALFWTLGLLSATGMAFWFYRLYFRARFERFIYIWLSSLIVWVVLITSLYAAITSYAFQPYVLYDDYMAPTYRRGDLILVETYDQRVAKGGVVLANIAEPATHTTQLQIERVRGVPGETEKGVILTPGYYYVANDENPQASGVVIPSAAILGKPIIDLGRL